MNRHPEHLLTGKRKFIFLKFTYHILAMLYFPLRFGIYPAKIFVLCSAYVYVCLHVCV